MKSFEYRQGGPAKIVVATTVALSFISFWRGAAIVLSDLASSAFYAGGIAEGAIGRSAPWFILAVMLFSFAVRSIYLERAIRAFWRRSDPGLDWLRTLSALLVPHAPQAFT